MKMMKTLFSISMLLVLVLSHVEIIDPDSLDWITTDGEKRPILRIVVNGETILLPLREAPFCRLADARECECFILRKGNDYSEWEVASFVKCDHEVRGIFLSTRYQFGIEPESGGKSGQHIIKKYKLENDPTETSAKVLSEEKQEEVTAKDAGLSDGFLKPLSEYGELFENETGYMTVKFVLSELFFRQIPESRIHHTLQNYINAANEYLMDLNLLAIYEGWTQVLEPETNLTIDVIHAFYLERYENYDEENTINAVILLGENKNLRAATYHSGGFCTGPNGIFIDIQREYSNKIELLWRLLYGLGFNMGLPTINRTVCNPGKGHRWIMEPNPKERNASMKWSNCSKETMQKRVKKHLACLKRKIEPKKPRCGNGWVDDGEECDCITVECQKCCINCRLTYGAECYNGPCCNKLTCMFADNGTQCRAADDSCDIPELCDGKSSECPSNFVVSNGYECQELPQRSYCFRGKCGSRSDVCGWASQNCTVASDACYKLNTRDGTDYGGCGPTFQRYRRNMSNYACKAPDMYCGKIFCHVEGNFTPTAESKRYFFDNLILRLLGEKEGQELCAFLGLSKYYRFLQEDPTFVPNGSECAPDHMCVKQRCTPLPEGCPKNCPGELRIHPYTKQKFPAHEIDSQPRPRKPGSAATSWLYSAVGSVFIIMVCGSIYFFYSNVTKITSEKSSIQTFQPSPSRETDSRSLSTLIRSAFARKLSEETSTVKDTQKISTTV